MPSAAAALGDLAWCGGDAVAKPRRRGGWTRPLTNCAGRSTTAKHGGLRQRAGLVRPAHGKRTSLPACRRRRLLLQHPLFETRRCSSLPAAVMLTSSWGQIAHLPRWKSSGDTHRARISAGATCFLAVRQRQPEFSLVHRTSFSCQHSQSGRGTIMAERELIGKDKLVLRGLQFHGFHGVKQEEKNLGQKFIVDVDAWMDLSTAGETDNISDTVSYTDIYRIVKDVVEGPSQNLLESVAHRIASATLLKFPQISAIRLEVGKPHVAVQGTVNYLGVEILRYREDIRGNSSGASLS